MISPSMSSCENTLNTLRYADRVKELAVVENAEPVKEDETNENAVSSPSLHLQSISVSMVQVTRGGRSVSIVLYQSINRFDGQMKGRGNICRDVLVPRSRFPPARDGRGRCRLAQDPIEHSAQMARIGWQPVRHHGSN